MTLALPGFLADMDHVGNHRGEQPGFVERCGQRPAGGDTGLHAQQHVAVDGVGMEHVLQGAQGVEHGDAAVEQQGDIGSKRYIAD